jgi:predicted GNAT family acetyltransferase
MTEPGENIFVTHNIRENRYEATVEGKLCVAEYVRNNDRMIFTHTFVPAELRGRGIAEKIVRAALADARTQKLKVTPACSYVARFIDRHPEYRELIAT